MAWEGWPMSAIFRIVFTFPPEVPTSRLGAAAGLKRLQIHRGRARCDLPQPSSGRALGSAPAAASIALHLA